MLVGLLYAINLVSQSSKEWILFIDGDLSLNNAKFIHNYLKAEGDVIVGGINIVENEKRYSPIG